MSDHKASANTVRAKKRFVIDVEKCTGCQLCIIACKDEHVGNRHMPWTEAQPETGHFWIDVQSLERGSIPRVSVKHLPLLCQHCENAPCIKACPEGAIHRRDDGLVWIDPQTCNGSGFCVDACPYDVIFWNDELDIAQKCTGCAHRVDEGALPRCVEVCPHDAIEFGDEDPGDGDDQDLEILHPEYEAQPRVYWRDLPKPYVAGSVIDPEAGEVVIEARVTAVDLFNDQVFTTYTDAFGEFWIRGLEEHHKYKVEITKDDYDRVVTIVTTDREKDMGSITLTQLAPKARTEDRGKGFMD